MSRTRPETTRDLSYFYASVYGDLQYTGLLGRLQGIVHRLMERPYDGLPADVILEVGAGNGQHVRHVRSRTSTYYETDLAVGEGLDHAGERRVGDLRVVRCEADAEDLRDFDDDSVDRVVATCLLAHLPHTERALAEWRRVTRDGGHITIYVPAEPGLMLRLGRAVATAPKARRLGSDFHNVVNRDHKNSYLHMKAVVRHVYADDDVRWRRYPFAFASWNFNLFAIVDVTVRKPGA